MDDSDRIQELETRVSDLESKVSKLEHRESVENTANTEADPLKTTRKKGLSNIDIEASASKLFVFLGGALLIFGTLFFIQLAISRGLLGPTGQLLLATLTGIAIASTGRYTTIHPWSKVVTGTGITIAYISIFASYAAPQYQSAIGTPYWIPAILLTVLLSITTYISITESEYGLTIETTLLYWATVGFFAFWVEIPALYALSLTAALITLFGITWISQWTAPILISLLPTYLYTGHLLSQFNLEYTPTSTILFVTLLLFFILTTEARRRNSPPNPDITNSFIDAIPVLNGLIGTGFIYASTQYQLTTTNGTALITVAILFTLSYIFATEKQLSPARSEPFIVYFTAALGFTAIGDDFTRILGITTLAMTALITNQKLNSKWAVITTHIVGGLLFIDALHAIYLSGYFTVLPIQTQQIQVGIALTLVLFYYSIFILHQYTPYITSLTLPIINEDLPNLYIWAGTVLLVVVFDLLLTGLWLSVSWGILGFTIITAGSAYTIKRLRIQGIVLLLVTTAKVFIIDTAELELLTRVFSFIILGTILLITSYLYFTQHSETSPKEKLPL